MELASTHKALYVARKTLRELWREPMLLGLMLAFPIMILGFYYIAFSQTDEGLAKHLKVWVINQDTGATSVEGEPWRAGDQLIDLMRGIKFQGAPIFDLSEMTDRHAAEISLREHKIALLLTIPPDFSQTLADASAGRSTSPALISLVGDPNSHHFAFAHNLIDELVRQFTDYAIGWQDPSLIIDYQSVSGSDTISDFEFGVPGMIVFGLMLLVMSTAQILVRENVNGTLRRLRLTRLRAGDLLLGVALAQMAIAVVKVPVIFGAAVAMGFKGHGSLLLAMGIGLLLSLSTVGLGLITACFARNDSEAANLGATVGVLMVLLSGTMYPMPEATLITLGGRAIQLYDLLPPTHAAEAMRQILIKGKGLEAIGYELAALSVLSGLFLAIGAGLYQRLQLRKT